MMTRYVLSSLWRHKTRTAMGVLGVLVTLALLTAVQVSLDSVALSYVQLSGLTVGKADVMIQYGERPYAIEPDPFDPAEASALLAGAPELEGFAPRLIARRDLGGRFVTIVGLDPAREVALGLDGFVPWPELGPGDCAISRALADKLDAGDVDVLGTKLRRVGVIERQQMFGQVYRDYIVTDLATAQAALALPGRITMLAGRLRDASRLYDARDIDASVRALEREGRALSKRLGGRYSVAMLRAQALNAYEEVGGPVRAAFLLLLVVALAITGLLIYSLVSVSAEERAREHAIVRVLGGKRRHLLALVLGEALLLCALGVAPGVLAGLVAARALVKTIAALMSLGPSSVTLHASPGAALVPLAAGVVLAVGSSLAPAIRASRGRIVDGLDPMRRGALERPPAERSSSRSLVAAGAVLSAASGLVFFLLPAAYLSGDLSLMGGIAVGLLLAMIAGFTLVGLGALPLVERAVLAPLGALFGAAADLAAKNVARYRRRATATSLMFAISVSFVVFAGSIVALVNRTATELLEQRTGADLRVDLFNSDHLDLEQDLRAVPGVRSVARVLSLKPLSSDGAVYGAAAEDIIGSKPVSVAVFGVDPTLGDVVYRERVACEEGDADPLAALAADPGLGGRSPDDPGAPAPAAIVSLALARSLRLEVGDQLAVTLRLGGQKRDVRLTIRAVCSAVPGFYAFRARAMAANGSGVLVSARAFADLTRDVPKGALQGFYLARVEGSGARIAGRVQDDMGIRHSVLVKSTEEQKIAARQLYWVSQLVSVLLLGAAVSIAAFSLIAAMATAAVERRWEVGVLKAVGVRRRQVLAMFASEAVALTVSSGAVGAIMGFSLAYLLAAQASSFLGVRVAVAMPWLTLGATVFICTLAGLVAAYLPTRRLLARTAAEILAG
jgi:putative ABC transport system permease protein